MLSPWEWYSWPPAAHVAISKTVSPSLWILQWPGRQLHCQEPRWRCVHVVFFGGGVTNGMERERDFVLSATSRPPTTLTSLSYYAPPSMCCCWIRLIKVPQAGSSESSHTHTYTHIVHIQSLMKAGTDAHTIGKTGRNREHKPPYVQRHASHSESTLATEVHRKKHCVNI